MLALLLLQAAAAAPVVPASPAAAAPGHQIIYSDRERFRAIQQQIGWADAVVAGDTVYVSGVVATTEPGDQGLEPAYVRAFDTLTSILNRAGVTWADVVLVRSYHTDPAAQIAAISKIKRRYRAMPDPAWTAVGTTALLAPRGITEIELIAHKPRTANK